MPWLKLSLPKLNYPSADGAELPQDVGGRMVDMFVDELGNYRSRPKLEDFSDLGTNTGVDGIYWFENLSYTLAVSGGKIFKIDINGSITNVTGDPLAIGAKVRFATDGATVVMANGGKMVTYVDGGTTTFMADANAPTAVDHVAYIGGYMLANSIDTKRWYYSSSSDITVWTALGFFSMEGQPDNLTALQVHSGEIALFGKDSIEKWWNDGSPFSRIETAETPRGVGAPASIEEYGDGSYVFLDDKRRVSTLTGRTARGVSGPIATILTALESPATARGMVIHIGEQVFYLITFRTDNRTFALELTRGVWSEWGEWNVSRGEYDKFRGQSYDFADDWNLHLIGDHNNGMIYKLNYSATDDAGSTVRSMLRTGPVDHGTKNRKRCHGIRITAVRGQSTDNESLNFSLRWRDDGKEWSNEIPVSLGKTGDTEYFVLKSRLGIYRTREWEIIHSHDTKLSIHEIEENVERLRN